MQVIFYATPIGRVPVREWLESFRDQSTRVRTEPRIDRLRMGNAGDRRALGGGLLELRLHVGAGYRVYHSEVGDSLLVLLTGGDKSSRSSGIVRAREYLREFQSRGPQEGRHTLPSTTTSPSAFATTPPRRCSSTPRCSTTRNPETSRPSCSRCARSSRLAGELRPLPLPQGLRRRARSACLLAPTPPSRASSRFGSCPGDSARRPDHPSPIAPLTIAPAAREPLREPLAAGARPS